MLDFDDLLHATVTLLRERPEVGGGALVFFLEGGGWSTGDCRGAVISGVLFREQVKASTAVHVEGC